jgi:hypothetical protein
VAPAGSAKRVRTTRRGAANNTSQGGADQGARSTISRDASSHRSPRASAARGHETTPAIRREDAGGGADSGFGELQQLLPTQLVLNQGSIGSSLEISVSAPEQHAQPQNPAFSLTSRLPRLAAQDHDMEGTAAPSSGPAAVPAAESAAVPAASRPPFSLSQALCAMGQCDILTLVFQNCEHQPRPRHLHGPLVHLVEICQGPSRMLPAISGYQLSHFLFRYLSLFQRVQLRARVSQMPDPLLPPQSMS